MKGGLRRRRSQVRIPSSSSGSQIQCCAKGHALTRCSSSFFRGLDMLLRDAIFFQSQESSQQRKEPPDKTADEWSYRLCYLSAEASFPESRSHAESPHLPPN